MFGFLMARLVTANLYMTLDGYGECPKYPGSDIRPMKPDDQFLDMWVKRYKSVDTVVFGRRSFEGHFNHFSEERLSARSAPKYLFDYRHWLDNAQKVVLSHKLTKPSWQNSRVMKGDLARVMARLRREPGKDIIVDGGPSVVQECMQRGLADDYRVVISPVVYGRGKHYWASMLKQVTLKLRSFKTLRAGELLLHYEAVR